MLKKYRKMPTDQLIDVSVNAVLPRTIMTATTVFLALLSLVIFGGEVIRSFSLAMIWGICVATYSSVFICSPMLIYLGLRNASAEPTAAPAGSKDAKAKPGAVKTA
jgi:preprotein translocase subunit SecF